MNQTYNVAQHVAAMERDSTRGDGSPIGYAGLDLLRQCLSAFRMSPLLLQNCQSLASLLLVSVKVDVQKFQGKFCRIHLVRNRVACRTQVTFECIDRTKVVGLSA